MRMLRRRLRHERGSVLILTALSLTLLMSFLALAVDVGNLYFKQCQLQTLADTAAMAGALEIDACAGTTNCGVMQTAATTALTEGGNPTPTLFKQCAAASGSPTQLLLTLNNGPCSLGSSDPNSGNINYVEAVVTMQQPTFFAKMFRVYSVQISARAEAGKSLPPGSCMSVIGPSGQSLTLNSGGSITDGAGSDCGVTVNSSSTGTCLGGTPAVMENAGGIVHVGFFNIKGNECNNGASLTPLPTTGASAVPDAFAAEITAGTLTVPTTSGLTTQSVSTVSGATTLNPGYYQNGINFNGSGYTVTLQPGLYYMGGGINVGGVTINGTGVTIYIANGQLNMNGGSTVNLTAPATGPTAGLVIWQAAGDTSAMNLDSASSSSWGGGIYLPSAQLTLNGGSYVTAYAMVVVQSIMLNSSISLSCSLMPGGVCPGGGGTGNGSTTIALAE
jgi:Flp pilus assembly protein TadG